MNKTKVAIFACVYTLLLLVCIKLAFSYFYNESIISDYEKHDYSNDVDPLLFCNVIQPYLAYYNMGNIHYQNGNYESAISEYQKALEEDPGHDEECDVRVNLALAIIKTLGEDYDTPENIEASIETLKEARGVLTEESCATDNGDGHSETAETLKEEIDKLIEELENSQSSEPEENNDPSGNSGDNSEEQDEYEQNIKEELQQQQQEAYQEREEYMDYYDELDEYMNFDNDGKVW